MVNWLDYADQSLETTIGTRQLYAETAAIDEWHVTKYEPIIDPKTPVSRSG